MIVAVATFASNGNHLSINKNNDKRKNTTKKQSHTDRQPRDG